MALQYRKLAEELLCSETNLERCSQQLNQQIDSASQQLLEADSTIKELVQRLEKRDQQIQIMASSWGWKLMRLWQRL